MYEVRAPREVMVAASTIPAQSVQLIETRPMNYGAGLTDM